MNPATAAEMQMETLALEAKLASLRANRVQAELIDAMGQAYANAQHRIEHGTRYQDCARWQLLNDNSKDAIRLGMLAAVEAAQRLKRERAG